MTLLITLDKTYMSSKLKGAYLKYLTALTRARPCLRIDRKTFLRRS